LVASLLALTLGDVALAQKYGAPPPRVSDRSERREFTLFYRQFTAPVISKPDVTLPALGTATGTFEIENTAMLGVQFGYNVREQLNLNLEFGFGKPDYKGTWGRQSFRGTGNLFTGDLNVEYNIFKKPFTPYVGAGLGLMYFDSNIPQGSPDVWCWWDYYWGYVCTTTQSSRDTTEFTYNLAGGVRWDINETLFMKFGYRAMWASVGPNGAEIFPQYILTFGWVW
jgi:opacity protein-like surface antigen